MPAGSGAGCAKVGRTQAAVSSTVTKHERWNWSCDLITGQVQLYRRKFLLGEWRSPFMQRRDCSGTEVPDWNYEALAGCNALDRRVLMFQPRV